MRSPEAVRHCRLRDLDDIRLPEVTNRAGGAPVALQWRRRRTPFGTKSYRKEYFQQNRNRVPNWSDETRNYGTSFGFFLCVGVNSQPISLPRPVRKK